MSSQAASLRAAAFLDRDGTLIVDTHFISRPEAVSLLPGVGAAVRRLNDALVPVVVVTNQSGIGRGLYSMADYERVRARVEALLAAAGARVDATYICPHSPLGDAGCACRKPGTLLHRTAAYDLALDLARSWYVGDRLRDVLPAASFGATGVLVPGPRTPAGEIAEARDHFAVAFSLGEVVEQLLTAR